MTPTLVRLSSMVFLLVASANAQSPCTTEHPNIVLVIADDLGAPDLPFASPPLDWDCPAGPPCNFASKTPGEVFGKNPPNPFKMMRQDLNRLAARMLACDLRSPPLAPCDTQLELGEFRPSPLVPDAPPPFDNPGAYPVVPWDGLAPAGPGTGHTYDLAAGDPAHDILEGFGGLNRLARDGIAFGRYYATAGVCAPTRSSIFTGRHPTRNGTKGNDGHLLDVHEVTIAEYLKRSSANQYVTGLIGKWHQGAPPWDQGFDEFVGHKRGCCRAYFDGDPLDCTPASELGGQQLYIGQGGTCVGEGPCRCEGDQYAPPRGGNQPGGPCDDNDGLAAEAGGISGIGCDFSVRVYRDLAINFIKRHRSAGTPFFLTVAFNAVHAGHDAPQRTQDHYRATKTERKPGSKGKYQGLIEEVDAAVGQILDTLGESPATANNTIVLFTSDQGANTGGSGRGIPRLRGGKFGTYEGGMRVGLFAKGCTQTHVSATKLAKMVASHVDLFPTIAEAAGYPVTGPLYGCDDESGADCTPDTQCGQGDPDEFTNECKLHQVEGKSFYDLLNSADPAFARDYAFARGGKIAVTARPQLPALTTDISAQAGVCAVLDQGRDGIRMLGASCDLCTPGSGDCDGAGKTCAMLGKVCVAGNGTCVVESVTCGDSTGSRAACAQTTPGCCERNQDCDCGVCKYSSVPSPLVPCKNDTDCEKVIGTGTGYACREVSVPCTDCVLAAWKLKPLGSSGGKALCGGTPPATLASKDGLFDVISNPEEADDLNCVQRGSGNPTDDGHLKQIWWRLKKRAVNWNVCMKYHRFDVVDCEAGPECPSQACAANECVTNP